MARNRSQNQEFEYNQKLVTMSLLKEHTALENLAARFLNYKDRESLLKAKKKLRGMNVFVDKDYSNRVMKKRMGSMPQLKQA